VTKVKGKERWVVFVDPEMREDLRHFCFHLEPRRSMSSVVEELIRKHIPRRPKGE